MSEPRPRAWLLLAAGDSRQYAGNTGYDDQADSYYTWDSTVNNYRNIQPGDAIALWDKKRLLGISVVEDIQTHEKKKFSYRCRECGRTSIKSRSTKKPRYRCQKCGAEFDEPVVDVIEVTEYRSRHDAAWAALEGLLDGPQLRELCEKQDSQLSMRALDWSRFEGAIRQQGAETALERVLSRALGETSRTAIRGGHSRAFVRVRRGQSAFRTSLLDCFGAECAFTGQAPERVLEAGHLYSYAALGEHSEHGGLLMRRDIHRLFDDGWLAVEPGTLKIDASEPLSSFPQYRRLHGKQLGAPVRDSHVEWLAKHWDEHRANVRG